MQEKAACLSHSPSVLRNPLASLLNPPKALGCISSKFEQQMRTDRFSFVPVHIMVAKTGQSLQCQEISPVSRRRRHAIILASAPNLLHKEVTKCDLQL
jgi:hypothetical protein